MPATIVVGGQYGSEGKGKVVALLASHLKSPWLVRCGGPNSGHTVTIHGKDVVLRQVPSCAEPSKATFCLAAGCVIDEEVLLRELDMLNIKRARIVVDPRAVIVTEQDREAERRELMEIASTCSGTDVYSGTLPGAPESAAISSQEISFANGPLDPPTLIGNVRRTITMFVIIRGERPASIANPAAVVSREVTNG